MSVSYDYAAQLLSEQKVQGFHAEAAHDRLVREARAAGGAWSRRPWWRLRAALGPVTLGLPANGVRRSRSGALRPGRVAPPVTR